MGDKVYNEVTEFKDLYKTLMEVSALLVIRPVWLCSHHIDEHMVWAAAIVLQQLCLGCATHLDSSETKHSAAHNGSALQALNEYNETNAVMDLVLFEDAMKHICRISRIISSPR